MELEARVLLSHLVATPRSASGHCAGRTGSEGRTCLRARPSGHSSRRDHRRLQGVPCRLRRLENSYVQAINDQSSGSVTVSAQLTQPYAAGASAMVVDNASVFGPLGAFTTPVIATATIGGVSNGTQYVFTGRSDSHTLIVNPGQSSQAAPSHRRGWP